LLDLTQVQLRQFTESAVWQEISARCQRELDKHRNLAIDDSSAKDAGWVRALEMVLGLPKQLMTETENDERAHALHAVSRYAR